MVTIRNGKFYKDGEAMPVEFGNLEQIKALEDLDKLTKGLKEGMELDYNEQMTVTYTASFKCPCGKYVYLQDVSDYEDQPDTLAAITKKCRCGKHMFRTYMEDGDLMVKEVRNV